MAISSKNFRVYVCSNFRDMQAERAHLREVVFPQVSRQCQEQGISFEAVDLRWGGVSEDVVENIDSLEHALAEIDRCRPWFIGILGARYGQLLDQIPIDVGRKYPDLRHYARSSRMHLEMLHGALRNPQQATQSYFYFRKPDFFQVPPAERSNYDAENDVAARKVMLLKNAIRASGRPVVDYDCVWDSKKKRGSFLEKFGERVASDLFQAMGIAGKLAAVPAGTAMQPPAASGVSVPVAAAGIAAAGIAGAGLAAMALSSGSENDTMPMPMDAFADAGADMAMPLDDAPSGLFEGDMDFPTLSTPAEETPVLAAEAPAEADISFEDAAALEMADAGVTQPIDTQPFAADDQAFGFVAEAGGEEAAAFEAEEVVEELSDVDPDEVDLGSPSKKSAVQPAFSEEQADDLALAALFGDDAAEQASDVEDVAEIEDVEIFEEGE